MTESERLSRLLAIAAYEIIYGSGDAFVLQGKIDALLARGAVLLGGRA